jgi:uncharacterized membrane protein YdjX (TVP38/TMEM64 family)
MRHKKITAGELLPAKTVKNNGNIQRYTVLVINQIFCLAMLILAVIFFGKFPLYLQIIIYVFLAADIFLCVFLSMKNKDALCKLLFTGNFFAVIFAVAYIIMDRFGIFEHFSNVELIKEMILTTGAWGKAVFMLFTLLQTVIIPVPAFVVAMVGTALYGPMQAFVYTSIGVIIGSIVCFYIGRLIGPGLVNWIAGAEKAEKYRKMMGSKGRFVFIMMMLLPVFPDDMLCMVAGLSSMSFGYFFLVIILTRPIMLAVYSFLGTGNLIPFSGWGIWAWIAIIIVVIALCILIAKKQDKIYEFFNRKQKKRRLRGFDSKDKFEL